MKRKTISKRSIPTNVARPTLNQQDPASARQLCKRLAGDNRTTKQQGDPRASLLLTSDQSFAKIVGEGYVWVYNVETCTGAL